MKEFSESEYIGEHFLGLDLSASEILSKEFEDCAFNECQFNEAAFRSCKFIDCNFNKCNLSNVNVAYSRFTNVEFDECKIIGVDWTLATWSGLALSAPFKFKQCILNDSSFFALKLSEIVLEGCKIHDVDFRDGDFSDSSFAYSDLTNSLFHNSVLNGADFTEATNYDINIHHNSVKGAKFSVQEAVRLLNDLEIELIY